MSIPRGSREVKPANDQLYIARKLALLGVPVWHTHMNKDGGPVRPGWQKITAASADYEIAGFKPGMAMCATAGVVFDVLDRDPKNDPGSHNWKRLAAALGEDGPKVFLEVATPSGGRHYYIASLGLGRKYNPIPGFRGCDLQGAGSLVFLPPTRRKGGGYSVLEESLSAFDPSSVSSALHNLIVSSNGFAHSNGVGSGRQAPEAHKDAVLSASAGEQRMALLKLVQEYERRGLSRSDITDILRGFLPRVPCFDAEMGPWYPAKGRGGPDRWIKGLFHNPGVVIIDASPDSLRGVRAIVDDEPVAVAEPATDVEFWKSRPVLWHIHEWARARMCAPWAVLGECLAEAICHTGPGLRTPAIVGGQGTLNMLVALVGGSGSGKNASGAVAREAFAWSGILGYIPDTIARKPVGSGEGLAKCFGRPRGRSEAASIGRGSVVFTDVSVIMTIAEIDTLSALRARGGSTITEQIRMFYTGEQLGFQYSHEQVIIPAHAYRGAVIAGVQPGRGEVIIGDAEGGFPQRWLWLPAEDPSIPDVEPDAPPVWEWSCPAPDSVEEVSEMKLADVIIDETRAMRRANVRGGRDGGGSRDDSHRNYTRLKVACGLALLDERCDVSPDDWDMAGYVMKVSDVCRTDVAERLAELKHSAEVDAGRSLGLRQEVAIKTKHNTTVKRVMGNIVRRMSGLGVEYSERVLRNKMTSPDRKYFAEAMDSLVESGVVTRIEREYKGQAATFYKKVKTVK